MGNTRNSCVRLSILTSLPMASVRIACKTFKRGWHVPIRSARRGSWVCHALRSSGRAIQTAPKGHGSPSPGQRPRRPTHVKDPSGLAPLVNKVERLRQVSAKTTDPHVLVTWVKEIGGHAQAGEPHSPAGQAGRGLDTCSVSVVACQPRSPAGQAGRGLDATGVEQRGRCPDGLGEPRAFGPATKVLLSAALLATTLATCGQFAERVARADEAKVTVREIFVPFADLDVLLENQPHRVLLSRAEYEDLLKKAKKTAKTHAPQGAVLVAADYTATGEEERVRWVGNLTLDVLEEDLQTISLDLSAPGLRSATLDGKPASIGRGADGRLVLFVEGKGRHVLLLEMVSPLQANAAQQVLSFHVPQPPAARFRLTMPGNVEIRSGASVASRVVDESPRQTRFELLAKPGDTALVMTLNSHLARRERAVVARSVLVNEVTQAYERLHATVSLSILHQATDRFRFALPQGFEITDVASPLVARWAIEKEKDRRVLDVRLREPTVETVVLNLSALKMHSPLEQWSSDNRQPITDNQQLTTDNRQLTWSFPQLQPLDVVGQVAVVGLLAEDRLNAEAIQATGLVPIDTEVLGRAMPVTVVRAEPGARRCAPTWPTTRRKRSSA